MKLSCLPISLFRDIMSGRMSLADWARFAAELKLDAIDLSILLVRNHTPLYLRQTREALRAEGMPVTMVTTYPDFSHPDRLQRERELAYLVHDIAIASELGARFLRIVAGQAHPGTGRREGLAWVLEGFSKSARAARRLGVQLVYENHSKPEAWDYPDFSQPTDVFLEVAEAIRDSDIRINFDTANPLAYGDEPLGLLERVFDRVVSIHAADTCTRGTLTPTLLGTGLVPFKEIFGFLKGRGFDGWVCVEEASGQGLEGVRKAVDFVRRTWESS